MIHVNIKNEHLFFTAMAFFTRSRFLRHVALGFGACLLLVACEGTKPEKPSVSPSVSSPKTSTPTAPLKPLKIGTSGDLPPFSYYGKSGKLKGFDIELMDAIAFESGYKVEYQKLPLDSLLPSLQTGKINGVISGITVTPEREKIVKFSRPYFQIKLAIAVSEKNNTIKNIDTLKGNAIGVESGTIAAEKAKDIPNVKVKTFKTNKEVLEALSQGKVDAILKETPMLLFAMGKDLKGIKIVGEIPTDKYYAIALPKDSQNTAEINKGLSKVIAKGDYGKLYQKYWNYEPAPLPETLPSK